MCAFCCGGSVDGQLVVDASDQIGRVKEVGVFMKGTNKALETGRTHEWFGGDRNHGHDVDWLVVFAQVCGLHGAEKVIIVVVGRICCPRACGIFAEDRGFDIRGGHGKKTVGRGGVGYLGRKCHVTERSR